MKQFICLVFLCFVFLYTPKANAQIYDLKKLLNCAIENNTEVKKANLQQSESNYKTKEVKANGLPQIDGNLDYSRIGLPDLSISSEIMSALPEDITPLLEGLKDIDAFHISSAGLTVSQLIYSQSYLLGVKVAQKAEEVYSTMQQKTEDEVIFDVASNYYRILMNFSTRTVLDENIQNLEKLYEIIKLQYENDFVKQTDVNRLKVNITNLETQRETLDNAILIQKRILKIIAGLPLDKEMELDTTSEINNIQEPVIPDFTLDILPDYQILQKQQELAGLKIKSDQAAYYPSLAAFGQLKYSSYNTDFEFNDFSNMNTIGLKATIPVFSSGIRKNKVMQSKLALQQVEESANLVQKQLGTSYRNATNSLLSSWKNLQVQKENKALAHSVYEQVKLQFNEGMASLTDLLNVDSALLEAENSYNQQLLKYRLAEVEMLKATGALKSLINN
jgi:outer membrane protein